jgi:hypothetical protein
LVHQLLTPGERRDVIQGVGVSRVTCYLALMVEGSDRLEVAFPRLLPRLPLLTPVREISAHAALWLPHLLMRSDGLY